MLCNFSSYYAIRTVQVHQDGRKLNGKYQLLIYANDINILGGRIHTINKNAETLIVANKETELEVNADKSKYMIMYRDQNAGRSHRIKIDNCSFEKVEEIKYLGTHLTNQNFIQGSLLFFGTEFLSSSLLTKNLKFKIYRTISLPVVLYGCEKWSLTLREERRLRMFENRVLRRIFGPRREEVT